MSTAPREYYLDSMGITRWRLRSIPEKNVVVEKQELPIVWFEQKPNPTIAFFAEFTNADEQKLLMAIVQACAKNEMYNIGTFTADMNAPLLNFQKILVFGTHQAQRLSASFNQVGLYDFHSAKVCVAHALKDLVIEPAHKRELWQTWQNLAK